MKSKLATNIIIQFNKMMCRVICFFLILFYQLEIKAQKEWSLNDCINYAIENNLTIKNLGYNAKIAKNDYTRSYADLGPSINANGGVNHYYGRTFNDETLKFTNNDYESGSYSININMVLFNGFQTINSIRKNYFIHQASIYNYEKNKIDIILTVTEKYFNILYAEDVLNTAKEQGLISQTQLDKSESMVRLGKGSRVDYLNVKAQYFLDKENIIKARNNLNLFIIDLSQILNLDSVANFAIQKIDNMVDTLYSPDIIYQEAVLYNPMLKQAEYKLKSSEKSLLVARGSVSPRISVGGIYSSNFNQSASNPRTDSLSYPYYDQLRERANQQVGISISIPIYSRLLVKNNISNAKLSVEQSKIELEQTKQILYNEIQRACADAQATLEEYHTKTETVNALAEAFQIMQERFNMGLISSIEFGISKNSLFIAQTELSLAKYKYILKTIFLQLYSGRLRYNQITN